MIFVLLAAMLILASLFGVFSIRESNLRHALDAHHTSTVASVKKQTSVLAAHAIALSQESSNALDHKLLTIHIKLNDGQALPAERALFSVLRTALETSRAAAARHHRRHCQHTDRQRRKLSRRRVHQVANLSVSEVVGQDIVLFRRTPQIAQENSLGSIIGELSSTALLCRIRNDAPQFTGRVSKAPMDKPFALPGTQEGVAMVVALSALRTERFAGCAVWN
ncbi:MAG: hypothetical protein ACLUW6_01390 [Coriobacteriaceae bacterium]